MCGIFASIGFPSDLTNIDVVAHRGPDGRGWREFEAPTGRVALGHRRLAIIDVSDAGAQPMADPSGRYHLVFNGELYNYLELRAELIALGFAFRTQTDSEVLLVAFIAWGKQALARFLGMFAFAIWDDRDKCLFVARDRFGIKPLYVVSQGGQVAVASEIKQLLPLPGVSSRMNTARVYDFLASGISDHTSETMFADVRQLRGGECAFVDASSGGSAMKVQRWYAAFALDRYRRLSEVEAAAEYRALLADSVKLHLRSDVPVGSCLSGGLDSSSIVCLMSGMLGDGARVSTVSACYAEPSVNEKPFIDEVVAATRSTPHFVYPRADDVLQHASDITWHQDEPFGSTSIFAQWCVFGAARRGGIKVMLDGQGADEQLAGYHASFHYYLADLARRRHWLSLAKTVLERRRMHGVPLGPQIGRLGVRLLPRQLSRRLIGGHHSLVEHNWLGSEAFRLERAREPALEVARELLGLPQITDIATLCVTLTFASNLQMLLHWEDRNSMAHSVEARVPFVDHRLVELALALGNDHKIVGADTKRVLRRAMTGVIPEMVRKRRDKLGFATPEQEWFRGPLREVIQQGVEATLRYFPDLLNPAGTRALVADMLQGRRPVDFRIWRIVNLGIWGDRFAVTT